MIIILIVGQKTTVHCAKDVHYQADESGQGNVNSFYDNIMLYHL